MTPQRLPGTASRRPAQQAGELCPAVAAGRVRSVAEPKSSTSLYLGVATPKVRDHGVCLTNGTSLVKARPAERSPTCWIGEWRSGSAAMISKAVAGVARETPAPFGLALERCALVAAAGESGSRDIACR
jgi:hypothetical protein